MAVTTNASKEGGLNVTKSNFLGQIGLQKKMYGAEEKRNTYKNATKAARSNILDQPNERKARLCEAVPCESETMELGLRHEELEPLLDFLYTGSLPWEKMEKHIHRLFSLAYSYEILYLWEFCARHILLSLTPSNALQVFEL